MNNLNYRNKFSNLATKIFWSILYHSRIEALQIAQLLALVIFQLVFSYERKSERIERKFITQDPI